MRRARLSRVRAGYSESRAMPQTFASFPVTSARAPLHRRARRMRAFAASLVFAVAAVSTVVLIRAGQPECSADRATVDALRLSPGLAS
jgi:hypothetical protein